MYDSIVELRHWNIAWNISSISNMEITFLDNILLLKIHINCEHKLENCLLGK